MRIIVKYILILIYFIIGITQISAHEQQIIDSLKKQNLNESNLEIVVDNNNEISFSFGLISIDSSLVYSDKARVLAEKIDYKYGQAISHSYTGSAMIEMDMFKNAIEHFNKSLNLFIELEDSINILDCYRGLAYVHSYSSSNIKSLDYDFNALKIAELLQDSNSLSSIYNNIGTIYTKLDNYDAAILYYGKTISIDEQLKRFHELAISYSNVGILKLENNKLREAAIIYNKVISLLPKINNPSTKSILFLSLSCYYTEVSNYDSAKYYIDLANKILTEYPYKHIQVRSLRREAEMLFKQKEYRKSIVFFNKCLQLSNSIGINENFPEIYEMKGVAYFHLNMYKKAYEFSELASSYNDSLLNKKTAGFLREFEIEQKIKEKEKLLLEMELKDQKVENARIKMRLESTISIAIIVLLIIIILVVIYFFLRIRKINSKLKRQHNLINSQKLMLEENIIKLTLSENNLIKLNSTKDKLFSIIAHDLRSPFNSILGLSELLIGKVNEFEIAKSKKYLGIINLSAKNTLVLLDNLLNWVKSQTGEINFKPQKIILASILNEIAETSNSSAKIKNIDLNYSQSEEIIVFADQNMIQTILRNLISNAIKFTNSNGEIDVAALKNDNFIEISVSDNGVGMDEETRNKLFRIETNESAIGTANETGTGLGLILCREFVKKHGGEIWVESELGKGSVFKFTLPVD